MAYVHELPDWPKLRWQEKRLLPWLAKVRHHQGRLLGRMEGLGVRLRAEATLANLTDDVIKSSAIEGEKLDLIEVRSSIARRLGLDFGGSKPVSRHVEGVVEMMLDATQRFAEQLTPERLFAWHSSLFPAGRSGLRKIRVGAWRPPEAGAMQVVSGPIGRERVHFQAPDAPRLEGEMHKFLTWFESEQGLDPVLKSGIAHFWFVTIHPFEDGNGRIGRAIMDMALARADGAAERFYSMSAQIEAERQEYYRQLERGQRGNTDITDWLEWFLDCLDRALDKAEQSLAKALQRREFWQGLQQANLNARQREVLDRLLEGFHGKLTTSKYAKLTKCSADTALRDINGLLELGALVREEGGGRSTSYKLRV